MQSKRNRHSCWKLITVFSVIVGTFPFTSLVLTLGRAAAGASAASERESATEKNARLSCFQQNESLTRCRLWRVSQLCLLCFICLFVLLLVPECTPADNPWQWQIRGGIFKVAAPVSAQRSFVPFIPSLSNSDRDDEWGSEVSLCLSEPDTTRL